MHNRPKSSVANLPNLGKTSAALLAQIDITDEARLRQVGAVEAYCLLKAQGHPVSFNLLWAMAGALTGTKWTELSAETKADLLNQVDAFRFG